MLDGEPATQRAMRLGLSAIVLCVACSSGSTGTASDAGSDASSGGAAGVGGVPTGGGAGLASGGAGAGGGSGGGGVAGSGGSLAACPDCAAGCCTPTGECVSGNGSGPEKWCAIEFGHACQACNENCILKLKSSGSFCGQWKDVGQPCNDPAECISTECDPNSHTCTFTCKNANEQCLSSTNCCAGLMCSSLQNICCRGPGTTLPAGASAFECCSGQTQNVFDADGGTITLCK